MTLCVSQMLKAYVGGGGMGKKSYVTTVRFLWDSGFLFGVPFQGSPNVYYCLSVGVHFWAQAVSCKRTYPTFLRN
jgi:hypothetical protein